MQVWSLEEGKKQRAMELQRRRELLAARRARAAELERIAAERMAELQRKIAETAAAAAAAAEAEGVAVEAAPVLAAPDSAMEPADGDNGRKRR